MNTLNFKLSITTIPTYLDGSFDLYKQSTTDDVFPIDKLKLVAEGFHFELLSISDRLKFESNQRDLKLTHKLRIAQEKLITAEHYIKINDEWHKVYNAYHFKNKDGYAQTDLTLQKHDKEVIIDD